MNSPPDEEGCPKDGVVEPFNETRYKDLLEGLEAVEVNLSTCYSIIDFRIDANTYKKDYIKSELLLKSLPCTLINDISTSVQNFGAYSLCNFINFTDSGIPFLMTQNIRHNYIDWNIEKFVDNDSHKMLWKSHCKKGQVLVTMAGEYLGRVSVYDKSEICSSNQAIAKVSLKKDQNPYIVSTFLNSIHGQNQINRFKTITGQPNINMALIKSLRVPVFRKDFQITIEKAIKESEQKRNLTELKYHQAETILLETLGIKDFQPNSDPINVKGFKESFLSTGRLDAEYYQRKYEEVISHIAEQKHDHLANIVTIKKSIEPGSDVYSEEGLPFLRVADYNKFGINVPEKKLNYSFCKENKEILEQLKPKKETILFSKDGSVGTAYMLRSDADFITSGAILHLAVKDKKQIIPEYLTLVLNSKLVQLQAERDAGGSIILHWRVGEIENVVVPIIDYTKQKEIAELVEESFQLKSQSEHLLETAIRAVEIAIEEGEEVAEEYLISF